jgi:hypothetical protein
MFTPLCSLSFFDLRFLFISLENTKA